jgi:hypothetical protein
VWIKENDGEGEFNYDILGFFGDTGV